MLRRATDQDVFFTLINSQTGAPLLDATVTVTVTGGPGQTSGAGWLGHLGGGQYKYVATADETNNPTVGFLFTAPNAVPVHVFASTIAANLADPTALGLTNLDVQLSSTVFAEFKNLLAPRNLTDNATSAAADFGVTANPKQVIIMVSVGILASGTSLTIDIEQSNDGLTWASVDIDLPVLSQNGTAFYKAIRSRRYLRASVSLSGGNPSANIAVMAAQG